MPFLYWGAQKSQYTRCSLTGAEWRGRIASFHLLARLFPMQPRRPQGCIAGLWSACCPPSPPGPSLQSGFPANRPPGCTDAWHYFYSYVSLCMVKKRLYMGCSVFLYSANAIMYTCYFRHVHAHTHKYPAWMNEYVHFFSLRHKRAIDTLAFSVHNQIWCLWRGTWQAEEHVKLRWTAERRQFCCENTKRNQGHGKKSPSRLFWDLIASN